MMLIITFEKFFASWITKNKIKNKIKLIKKSFVVYNVYIYYLYLQLETQVTRG